MSKTNLIEESACRRDLYMTTHSIHNGQTSLPPGRFEQAVLISERPQTYALDRRASKIKIKL